MAKHRAPAPSLTRRLVRLVKVTALSALTLLVGLVVLGLIIGPPVQAAPTSPAPAPAPASSTAAPTSTSTSSSSSSSSSSKATVTSDWTTDTASDAPTSNVSGYPACTLEDGSGPGQSFPCYWDATTQGNGHGDSYVLTGPADDVRPAYPAPAVTPEPEPQPQAATCR